MVNQPPLTDLVDEAYEDVALILGGFLTTTRVLDEAAWKLAGEVSGSWFRTASRARSLASNRHRAPRQSLHPSVKAMLAAIRSGSKSGSSTGDC